MTTTTFFCIVAVVAVVAAAAAANAEHYDPEAAFESVHFAVATTCDPAAVANWTCGPDCALASRNFQTFRFYENKTTQARAYSGVDLARRRIVLAIRGTITPLNWIEDAEFKPIPFSNPECRGPGGGGENDKDECLVYDGFHVVWASLRERVLSDLAHLTAKYPTWPLLVTGHSLGGACAFLASLDAARAFPKVNVTTITFGQPRTSSPALAWWATAGGGLPNHRIFRVTHRLDPVPRLIFAKFLGATWMHPPHEVWYDNDGNTTWTQCRDSPTHEAKNCINSEGWKINPKDHVLYLGVHMNCADAKSEAVAESAEMKERMMKMMKI